MKPPVYILLPVYNRRAVTARFIDCLVAQSYTNYHLILIDDGSTDGTDAMVKEKVEHLTIISGKGDWWWAGSLQQGIDWLKRKKAHDSDVVAFMNDDMTFGSDFLQTAVEILERQDGMLLPQVIHDQTGQIQETGVEADLKKLTFKSATSPAKINCLSTRGLFMRISDLWRTGDFHPVLLPHYLSDYEFTIRAHRKGLPLRTSPELLIRFDEAATGYRTYEKLPLHEFLRRNFSKRSNSNPIYWTTFVMLVTPKLYVPWNILRIWLGVFRRALLPTAR